MDVSAPYIPSRAPVAAARRPFPRLTAPTFVLLGSLALTFAAWAYASRAVETSARARFGKSVLEITEGIQSRMQTYVNILAQTRGFFDATPDVTVARFHTYVESISLQRDFPGIQGIGYAVRVPAAELAAHEEAMRAQGRLDYKLYPDNPRDTYFAISLLEPSDWRNRRAIGFDMYTEPTRRAAMEAARDAGEPRASGRVVLVQEIEANTQPGFLIYVPRFAQGAPAATAEERRAALLGYVYAPFRAGDLFEGIFGPRRPNEEVVDYEVYDGHAASNDSMLYDRDGSGSGSGSDFKGAHFSREHTLLVAGRPWTLRIRTLPAFDRPFERAVPWALLAFGLPMSFALYGTTLTLRRREEEERAGRAAAERLASRNRLLAETASALATPLDFEERLRRIAQLAVPEFADWCCVDMLDEGEIRRLAVAHVDPAKVKWAMEIHRRYPPELDAPAGLGKVLRTGRAELMEKVDQEWLLTLVREEDQRQLVRELGFHSWMIVPLIARDRVLGAVTYVWTETKRHYDAEDLVLAEEIGRRAAIAIDNARLYQESQRSLTELRQEQKVTETLNGLGRLLVAELDLDRLLHAVTDAAVELTGASFGAFFYNRKDDSGESYMLYSLSGLPKDAFSAFPMPRNTAIFAPTFKGEGTVRIADVTQDPRYGHNAPYKGMPEGHPVVRSYLAVPVVSRGGSEVIGGLFLGHPEVGVFEERQEKAAEGLATQAAMAIENARLFERVRGMNEDLERRVRDRTAQLTAANRELEAFGYTVSHDLRAPLRTIDGFSAMVLERYGEKLDEQGKDFLGRVRGGAIRMSRLIDDMLALSQVTRREMRKERVDLSALAEQVLAELRADAPERLVTTSVQPGLVVTGDESLLRAALSNLLGNAWKFTSKHPTARIEVGMAEKDGRKAYFVKDDGAGFKMEYRDKLFGAFQRLHKASDFPGTGVGLASVQRIVHRHGGEIWAEGAPEQGATFWFTLSEGGRA